MSKYTIKDPRCARCDKSLRGQVALMVRWVKFYEETDQEANRYTYGIRGDALRYQFNSQKELYCEDCAPKHSGHNS